VILIAGGTGFAPIKAIVEHALHHRLDARRPFVLYWGARAKQDLYLPDLPGRWQQQSDNFTFIPVLPIRCRTTRGPAAPASSTAR
jgi:CDP-4-dehydro-6-deoxyglucose reductase